MSKPTNKNSGSSGNSNPKQTSHGSKTESTKSASTNNRAETGGLVNNQGTRGKTALDGKGGTGPRRAE